MPNTTEKIETDANDACEVLGVARSDSWDTVKARYRRLLRDLHPDMQTRNNTKSTNTTARFHQVQIAYEFLAKHPNLLGRKLPEPKVDLEAISNHYRLRLTTYYGVRIEMVRTRQSLVRFDELVDKAVRDYLGITNYFKPVPLEEVEKTFNEVDLEIGRLLRGS